MHNLRKYLTLNNIVLGVALILALSWAWSTIGVLQKNYDLQRQVEQGRLDNEIIEIENQNLALQQAYYKTDEFLELQAREKLNKALPGEHLVVLPRISDQASTDMADESLNIPEQTNFEQWMEFLFGRG